MDDDNSKEENQPSTSKKESQRLNVSNHDLYDERGHDNPVSNSESSVSVTYSVRSRLDIAEARPEIPKPLPGKHREQKPPERKKRGRQVTGRVDKRKKSTTRRQVVRRAVKRRPRAKEDKKKPSISSIYTRLSSAGSQSLGCVYCGHRYCRRRFKEKLKRKRIPRNVRRKHHTRRMSGLESIQVGSASRMLSPLFVNTSSLPKPDETAKDETGYCEITPQMIYESLQRLSKWRQYVLTSSILDDMKKYYPVNPEQDSLLIELREKLRIADIIGIVTNFANEYWCLSCALQNRQLTQSHVSRFWQAYGDTMKPVTKKQLDERQKKELAEKQTRTYAKKTNLNIVRNYI